MTAARVKLQELAKVRQMDDIVRAIGSPATIRRMLLSEKEHPNSKFSEAIMRKAVAFTREAPPNASLYALLGHEIRQSPHDRASIASDYVGEYVYFRHTAREAEGMPDPKYVLGRIRIFLNEANEPCFEHWSSEKSKDEPPPEPEHRGYVYRSESQLFFLGWRYGVLRLAIARTRTREREDAFLPGVVVSVRTGPRDPFAARFVMVPEQNTELIRQLDPDQTDDAEDQFFELTEGRYSHYMLVHSS